MVMSFEKFKCFCLIWNIHLICKQIVLCVLIVVPNFKSKNKKGGELWQESFGVWSEEWKVASYTSLGERLKSN